MAFSIIQRYEEMIGILRKYLSQADELLSVLEHGGKECLYFTDDPAVAEAVHKLNACTADIRAEHETFGEVIYYLEESIKPAGAVPTGQQGLLDEKREDM